MFKNWSIRKKILVIFINSVLTLFVIGLIGTFISPGIRMSLGSSIFYSLTITLPILLIRYYDSRKVKILSYTAIIFAVIVILFGMISPYGIGNAPGGLLEYVLFVLVALTGGKVYSG